jgi:TPR repeat protein
MQMGQTYRRGRGVPLDLKLAFRYYMIGAISGHCDAMNSLAMRYELGQGTSQNHYAAFQWYARAAERKSIWATLHLGNFPFSHGLSFVPSKHSICHLIRLHCDEIGECYADGIGCTIDRERAIALLLRVRGLGSDACVRNANAVLTRMGYRHY